jgi:phage-related protein
LFKIRFYKDNRGVEPVREFMDRLASKKDKNSRVNYNKISAYIQTLMREGVTAGMPMMRHLEDGIWELRPIDNRILFAAWDGETFVLLHQFLKQTQQTPRREIETAKRRLAELRSADE